MRPASCRLLVLVATCDLQGERNGKGLIAWFGGKYQRDSLIELVPLYQAHVNFSHDAARVDEHCRGLSLDSIRSSYDTTLVERYRKRYGKGFDELLDILEASLLIPPIYSDHTQAGLPMFRLYPYQLRKLFPTGRAPCPPERNDDSVSAELRQLEATARKCRQVDIGRSLAWCLGVSTGRCNSDQQRDGARETSHPGIHYKRWV
jgi:hypothetical protein